jgi:spore maturation protein CgeB
LPCSISRVPAWRRTVTRRQRGYSLFLTPDEDVLVARDGKDVVAILGGLTEAQAREIGQRARRRVLAEHTYAHRARQVDSIFRSFVRTGVKAAE